MTFSIHVFGSKSSGNKTSCVVPCGTVARSSRATNQLKFDAALPICVETLGAAETRFSYLLLTEYVSQRPVDIFIQWSLRQNYVASSACYSAVQQLDQQHRLHRKTPDHGSIVPYSEVTW